jgi:hypothetical protein
VKSVPKRRVVLVVSAIVLILFLLHPGASRLKSRIIYAMSAAVGRPVDIQAVHIRFLPRPGFDLENLVVYDDPAFGAEPILRAADVTAALRVTSLFRGRLEIARLDLTEPSLNLVHGLNGRWNLEALLERSARTPLAPTAKSKSEQRPAFPYIGATSARINFKNGPEKKLYALTNTDFSFWQESENTWGVRVKAQPFRTDMNLNDIGELQASGTWQRAQNLQDTPLQVTLQWSRAQLGQISKYFTGNDQGWRGSALVNIELSGTPRDLRVASNIAVEDFRRYDITSGDPLRLMAHCESRYSSAEHVFRDIACDAPVKSGLVALKGQIGLAGGRTYDLVLTAVDVPAASALAVFQRAKKNLADDITAEGKIEGSFLLQKDPFSARFEGKGQVADLELASESSKVQIGPETLPFSLVAGSAEGTEKKTFSSRRQQPDVPPHVEIGPFRIAGTRGSLPLLRGWVSRTGYNFNLTGDADLARILHLGQMFGVPALRAKAEGSAQLDLQIAGLWVGPAALATSAAAMPQVVGTAKLKNVHVALATSGPIEISSAEVQLVPDVVRVLKLNAKLSDANINGSLSMPRGCGTPSACEVHFDLNANQLSLSGLAEWVNSSAKDRPWYRVITNSSKTPSFLSAIRASGRVGLDRLQLKSVAANRVSAIVTLNQGMLEVSQLKADLLGGKHLGEWRADFTAKPSICQGSGSLNEVSLAQVADAMHDRWISGVGNGSYEVKSECAADFWGSAEGQLQFDLRDGTLPHLVPPGDSRPLKLTHMTGEAHLLSGEMKFSDAQVDSPVGKFLLSGTVSLARKLDLNLTPPKNNISGYSITGSLSQPHMELSGTSVQARLKADSPK